MIALLRMAAPADAESWCAGPLIAHEWGVTVLLPAGGAPETPTIPDWFHHDHATVPAGPAVRLLPPDSGLRDLPVVQFYAPEPWSNDVPIGVEVGFSAGAATAWFPAISSQTPAATANGPLAQQARRVILEKRAANTTRGVRTDPGADPTRQLHWDRLLLQTSPVTTPEPTAPPWVLAARAVPDALWVNGPGESDRFLFYEGQTRETSALVVERGDSDAADHFVLRNRSDADVFDVVFVHDGRVWTAPAIPAGKSAGFLLRDPHNPTALERWLTARWTDDDGLPKADWSDCVMMRDPAIPAEVATGHRLFPAELGVLFTAWESRFFEGPETRLLYREDTAALDTAMPISLYTDMFHVPELHRLGVVLVERPPLP